MAVLSASAGGGGDPVALLATNTVILDSIENSPNLSINFGDESGSNRLLLAFYYSTGIGVRVHSAPVFDGTSGILHGQIAADGGRAGSISSSYWKESELPSTSGSKTFNMTLSGNQRGHNVTMMLFENVDQTTPVGTIQNTFAITQTPTFASSLTATSLADVMVALGTGASDQGSPYVSGDAAPSANINAVSEMTARDNPGGTHRAGWDIVPDSSEVYTWNWDYGSSTSIDAIVSLLVSINKA